MRPIIPFLFVVGLAACGAPTTTASNGGFNKVTVSGRPAMVNHRPAAAQSGLPRTQDYMAQRKIDAAANRQIKQAMERSFGRGTARDGRMVTVAGTPMSLRVVNVQGYSFAVIQKRASIGAQRRGANYTRM